MCWCLPHAAQSLCNICKRSIMMSTCLYYLLSMDFNFVRDADQEMRMKAILSVEDCALRGMLTQLTASKILYSLGKLNVTWDELSAPEQETLKNVLKCCLAETNLWDLMEGLQGAARMKMPITNQMWYSMENTIALALKGDLEKKPTQNETKAHAQVVATNVSVLLWSLATILRMPSPSNTASQQSPTSSSSSTSTPGEVDSVRENNTIDIMDTHTDTRANTRTIRLEDELLIGDELQSVLHDALLKTLPDTDYGRFAITIWSLGKLRVGSKIMADFQLRVALEDAIYKLVPLMDSLNLSNLLHGLGFLDVKFQSLLPSSRKVLLEGLHRQSMFMNAKDVFGILRGFAFMGTCFAVFLIDLVGAIDVLFLLGLVFLVFLCFFIVSILLVLYVFNILQSINLVSNVNIFPLSQSTASYPPQEFGGRSCPQRLTLSCGN